MSILMFIALVNLISTDAPVSNKLNIEQAVSGCLNISTVVEHTNYVDSFGSWCIIASLTSETRWRQWYDVPLALVRSSSDIQISNYIENL